MIYKTLLHVKLLHEYFLSGQKGETIFAIPAQADRMNYLMNNMALDQPSASNLLDFIIPDAFKKDYQDQHIRILPTYSGFKVAIEVNATVLPDNTTVYTPKIPLDADFSITVLAQKKSSGIDSVTNTRIGKTTPAIYYFTNEDLPAAKIFPQCCNPVAAFDAGKTYEQGELAFYGANDIRSFYSDGGGPQWRNISGSGFVNEADRLLVSPRFYYSFPTGANITDADFELVSIGGTSLKTFSVQSTQAISRTLIDFSALPLNTIADTPDPSLLYKLNVNGSGGYSESLNLLFVPESINLTDQWALMQFKVSVNNVAFDLLDSSGRLIRRKNPDGTWVEAPIFELPVTSRLTYWRYINDKKLKFNNADFPSDFLDFTDRVLTSKTPRPATYPATLFKKADNTWHYLPNPLPDELIRVEQNRLFTDIIVPKSKLFPVVP